MCQHPSVVMSEKSEDKKGLDLSALDFGPAWARGGGDKPKRSGAGGRGGDAQQARGRRRGEQGRGGDRKDFRGGGRRDSRGSGRRDGQRGGRAERVGPVPAPQGVEAEIMPIEAGVDNMAKELAAAGRTYSVFDLAYVVLGARERFHIVFRKPEDQQNLLQCRKDESVFLTKEECLAHFHQAEWKGEFYVEEEVECEAPAGNFQAIARCGISGEILGPPNYHAYQTGILELHRSRFSHMDLERFKASIETERSEEAVEAWRETMRKKVQYKVVGDEGTVLEDKSAVENHFREKHLDEVFRATHRADVPSAIPAKMLSPGLLTLLKETIADQRRYPGKLASFLCRQLSGRHLAVFKWRGKLHCGPSRPHAVPKETKIADRPQAMLEWIRENPGGGIDSLWKAVLPEGVDEEGKKGWYHDLHWLLNQGYAVLMSDGHLFGSEQAKKKPGKKRKADVKKADSDGNSKQTEKKEVEAKEAPEGVDPDGSETSRELGGAPAEATTAGEQSVEAEVEKSADSVSGDEPEDDSGKVESS